jgi:hypothetical protein
MTKKIAFCFLLKDAFNFPGIWASFFQGHERHYNIYSHIKFADSPKIPDFVKAGAVKPLKTKWCGNSLVNAFIKMIKQGLKDPENEYFIILCGDSIPLYNFDYIYNELITNEKRSRMQIQKIPNDFNNKKHLYGSQWVVFNRKTAIDFTGIKKYYPKLEKIMNKYGHCPDEMYPIYYFKEIYNDSFNKKIINRPPMYTQWVKGAAHPITLTKDTVNIKKMCNGKSLFARKVVPSEFTNGIAMACNVKKLKKSKKKILKK